MSFQVGVHHGVGISCDQGARPMMLLPLLRSVHCNVFLQHNATPAADTMHGFGVIQTSGESHRQADWVYYPQRRHAPQARTHLPSLDGLSSFTTLTRSYHLFRTCAAKRNVHAFFY